MHAIKEVVKPPAMFSVCHECDSHAQAWVYVKWPQDIMGPVVFNAPCGCPRIVAKSMALPRLTDAEIAMAMLLLEG